MRDYQESVTTGQTDTHKYTQTDAGQSDPYVLLCFAGNTIKHGLIFSVWSSLIKLRSTVGLNCVLTRLYLYNIAILTYELQSRKSLCVYHLFKNNMHIIFEESI